MNFLHNLEPAVSEHWCISRDGDPYMRAVFDRHYSRRRYRDGRSPAKFVGPGEYMALISRDGDAIFVWRKFIDDAVNAETGERQTGVNCAVFRNESSIRSSDMIREAESLALARWPGSRLYTYVNAQRIKSANPGFCFKMAGWRRCGVTMGGLIILEKLRADCGEAGEK
jgi:hypothetical protein